MVLLLEQRHGFLLPRGWQLRVGICNAGTNEHCRQTQRGRGGRSAGPGSRRVALDVGGHSHFSDGPSEPHKQHDAAYREKEADHAENDAAASAMLKYFRKAPLILAIVSAVLCLGRSISLL